MGRDKRTHGKTGAERRQRSALSLGLLSPLLIAALLSATEPLLRLAVETSSALQVDTTSALLPPPVKSRGVIVVMFQHSWDSIALECENWLGPSGVAYAQVSPPSEHIRGPQWWTDYKLVSKRGSRQQFEAMVRRCNAAGVGIIVDAVLNLAGPHSGTGVDGTPYSHYEYSGTYRHKDFHQCGLGRGGSNEISDYNDRRQVQECELVGLADLATESPYVVGRLSMYLNDLMSLGVAGFRVDSAKHMAAQDLGRILRRVKGNPYIVHETPWSPGEPITPDEYTPMGDAYEFRSASSLLEAFNSGNLAGLLEKFGHGWVPSRHAAVFVVNHDTEREGWSLNHNSAHNAHDLATFFLLAQSYGTPSILSSYEWHNRDDGPPRDHLDRTATLRCDTTTKWRCEHRRPSIINMIRFNNAVRGMPRAQAQANGVSRVAFGRGAAGFLAINYEDEPWVTTLSTNVPDGQYCDLIHDSEPSPRRCNSFTIDVVHGRMSVVIPPRDALAVLLGSGPGNGTATTSLPTRRRAKMLTIFLQATAAPGQRIVMTGSRLALGSWNPAAGVVLTPVPGYSSIWTASVSLFEADRIEYKFVKLGPSGDVDSWESGPNRVFEVTANREAKATLQWQ